MYNSDAPAVSVLEAAPSARVSFIRKTYAHLAGAILAFIGLEYVILSTPLAEAIARTFLGGQYSWAIVLIAFMGISWVANWWASNMASPALQYLGLSLFVVAEVIIFVPLLYIANAFHPGVIQQAAIVTLALFAGLTATVFITRKDFSFLGPILAIGGFVALALIFLSIFIGFNLGILFVGVMIVFASGCILYDTSKIMHHYHTDQHVAASLSLFASVALLFWYILRLFMRFND